MGREYTVCGYPVRDSNGISSDNSERSVKGGDGRLPAIDMSQQEAGRVLIVDDDEALTTVYATWLQDEYDVQTATSGREALDVLDADVSVILLDRRMPGLPGEAVLDAVRDAGYDCRVAMVTGVRPDADVLDLGFDDYLVKPVSGDDLRGAVDRLLERQTYDDRLQQYYALASKRAALEAELDRSTEPTRIQDAIQTVDSRLERIQHEMSRVVDSFGFDDFRVAFRDLAEPNDD